MLFQVVKFYVELTSDFLNSFENYSLTVDGG